MPGYQAFDRGKKKRLKPFAPDTIGHNTLTWQLASPHFFRKPGLATARRSKHKHGFLVLKAGQNNNKSAYFIKVVFASDGVGVGVVSGVVKSVYDLVKVLGKSSTRQNRSQTISTFPFSSYSAYDSVVYREISLVGSKGGRINQRQYLFPRFVISLVYPLLLALRQPSVQLIVSDGIVSGIRTLFSLDRKVLLF